MKKFIRLVLAILVVVLLLIYVPYYLHICDSCDSFFVGPGYETNIVIDAFSEEDEIICKECAKEHHAISSAFGKDVSEYRRPLIKDPVSAIKDIINEFK